ncbi:acyl-CoA thioesterase [Shewanella sp. SR43-4]|jgi:acyl-CoA thioester hydrolase|uniref:Acyl-CoA thioesterase n=1 Tax=Shewanella vesiculosa TaxID=518738 RepID=A0ABV0FR28_9GAMM|nr:MULTISPECIES: acyl-CoA thioesterase [Shewanella]NCQ44814.1 acyl-CoA thioesterase [Shewanella frigidimarina]MBB1317762.1 acyl-CoA thioesterase [Shewanella sp. SR43-4]MBB1322346.1 acyl-CoA thioesterase [Shewanella sp. SR43-8]MBB1475971.1 acyl-CoA thioesterase [Shewanella sp. SG41-3]NCO71943.1 acyl-CoA thioesterase [Shewanella vesiculosa]|tara:strand:+ start:5635 stop:6066 length:432 start_codon:yes stop_codon:yes gene_type:complete
MKGLLLTEMDMVIPFHDVDSMGITWHGNYLRYFEVVRCLLLDKLGYNYRTMQQSGYAWPIVDVQVKYVKSSTFDQKIKVIAAIVEWENRLRINYQIVDAQTNARITKGYTIQAAVDITTEELCFVTPEVFQEKIRRLLDVSQA